MEQAGTCSPPYPTLHLTIYIRAASVGPARLIIRSPETQSCNTIHTVISLHFLLARIFLPLSYFFLLYIQNEDCLSILSASGKHSGVCQYHEQQLPELQWQRLHQPESAIRPQSFPRVSLARSCRPPNTERTLRSGSRLRIRHAHPW